MFSRLRSLWRDLRGRDAFESQMSEELRFHIDSRIADLQARGLPLDEARRQARREFGNPLAIEDRCRDARRLTLLDDLRVDLRFAVRNMRRDLALTSAIVATLGIGIGATAAMFSAVDAALLRPLPYPAPSRLMIVYTGSDPLPVFGPDYTEFQGNCGACTEMAAMTQWQSTVAGGAASERVLIGRVTPSFFATLGIQPVLGRTFLPTEMGRGLFGNVEEPIENAAVILGAALWRRQFGGDPAIVGRTISIEGDPSTVVGVMPDGFSFPDRAEAWVPATIPTSRKNAYLRVIVRLRPDTSVAQGEAAFNMLMARLEAHAPDERRPRELRLVPLQEHLVGDVRTSLTIFLAAVGLVLLIACANVANLLLAQAATRPREIAIRTILGAGRRRIVRQLLTESLVLAAAGGAAGLAIAGWILDVFRGTLPEAVPRLNTIGLDGRVLAFVAAVSIGTGLAFGLAPAWRAATPDLSAVLKSAGTRGAGTARRRLRGALVIGEVSMALILLIAAGLLLKSFMTLRMRPLGFTPDGAIAANVTLPETSYASTSQTQTFFREALDRLQAQPEFAAVGLVNALPLARSGARIRGDVTADDEPQARKGVWVSKIAVGGEYFRAMGMTLLRGRLLDARDTAQARGVFVVSQSAADRLWPGQDPIGRRLSIWRGEVREVVGVVGDVKQEGLRQGAAPAVYESFEQVAATRRWQIGEMAFVIRPAGGAAAGVQRLRSTLQGIDKHVPLYDVAPLRDVVADDATDPRFYALLMGSFSLIALALSVAGVYGVMSCSVRQRTHELGVRLALGARRSHVIGVVMREGMVLVALGAILGVSGAYAATRVLGRFLFEVGVTDAATFLITPIVLCAVALMACYIPARRATTLDPLQVLKYE